MQEIEVRVSSGIPPALQLTSQRSPVHTTPHVANADVNTGNSGNDTENTTNEAQNNDDKNLRLDGDGVNSRGSTTGEDSSSTGANEHHGSSSDGGEEFCPMDLSSGGGACDLRGGNMSPSAVAASALVSGLPSSAAMVAAAAAAAANAAARESHSSTAPISAKSKALMSSLPPDLINPLFNARKFAELFKAQKEKELNADIDIQDELQTRLPKKRAFPELELDLSRMVKERIMKQHGIQPPVTDNGDRTSPFELGSSNRGTTPPQYGSEEAIKGGNLALAHPPEMIRAKWELTNNKQTSQRRSTSPADSNASESTSNSTTSASAGNAEVKKRRLDALLNKKFSSPASSSETSPPQRRESLDSSLATIKNRRRKQPHPSSPASSSSSVHSHSSPPPLSTLPASQQFATPHSSSTNNNITRTPPTPTTPTLPTGLSLSIRPVAELLSKHVSSTTSSNHRNKSSVNNNNNNQSYRRTSSTESPSPNKRHRPNNNSNISSRTSQSPLKILKPTSDSGTKHLAGLMGLPPNCGSNDLLMPAIRQPSMTPASRLGDIPQQDPHQSDLLKGQILQLQLAQAAIQSALPLPNPDILKMASLLGGGTSPGIGQAAAANPLLYYGYYAQMLQGILLDCMLISFIF